MGAEDPLPAGPQGSGKLLWLWKAAGRISCPMAEMSEDVLFLGSGGSPPSLLLLRLRVLCSLVFPGNCSETGWSKVSPRPSGERSYSASLTRPSLREATLPIELLPSSLPQGRWPSLWATSHRGHFCWAEIQAERCFLLAWRLPGFGKEVVWQPGQRCYPYQSRLRLWPAYPHPTELEIAEPHPILWKAELRQARAFLGLAL